MATTKSPKNPAKQPTQTPKTQPPASTPGASKEPGGLKISDTTLKTCKPFVLQVMVFTPKSGYKIEVNVEKSCTPQADAVWKLVFDLYKKQQTGDGFDQLVHVSYTGATPVEQQGLEATAARGINGKQADALVNRVAPAVSDLENSRNMTPAELEATKTEIKTAAKDVATFAL